MRLVFGCMPLDPRILKCCHDCCFVLCVDEVRLSEVRSGSSSLIDSWLGWVNGCTMWREKDASLSRVQRQIQNYT